MNPRQNVLIVDDEPGIRAHLEITLGRMRLHTRSARTLSEAQGWLDTEHFDLCLTDLHLPDGSGLELLQHTRQSHPQLPVAMMTTCEHPETAIQALKAGAFDFLNKPLDRARLYEVLSNALQLPANKSDAIDSMAAHQLTGHSAPMQRLRKHIAKLALSAAPIYINGESGSGKERVARLIHEQGPRARSGFIPVNCGAIPSELMESEFFGHRKGSFSGAIADKPGLFQAADSGTLFLDEVADLPLAMQVKLLRALQEKAIRSVGSQQEQKVDVRVLCATHKDLEAEVEAGRFRRDLYYRLNVIELSVPPLRARPEDIEPLTKAILERLALNNDSPPTHLQPAALQALLAYGFPGNVRELENLLERAHTLCEGRQIEASDLRLAEHDPTPSEAGRDLTHVIDLEDYLQEVERKVILQALEATRWNRTAAAQRLSLSLRSMRYRLKKLGLD